MTKRHSALGGAATLLGAFALSACNPTANSAPGAVSEGEAAALEDAAEMLDERQLPEGTLPPTGAAQTEPSGENPEQSEQMETE